MFVSYPVFFKPEYLDMSIDCLESSTEKREVLWHETTARRQQTPGDGYQLAAHVCSFPGFPRKHLLCYKKTAIPSGTHQLTLR